MAFKKLFKQFLFILLSFKPLLAEEALETKSPTKKNCLSVVEWMGGLTKSDWVARDSTGKIKHSIGRIGLDAYNGSEIILFEWLGPRASELFKSLEDGEDIRDEFRAIQRKLQKDEKMVVDPWLGLIQIPDGRLIVRALIQKKNLDEVLKQGLIKIFPNQANDEEYLDAIELEGFRIKLSEKDYLKFLDPKAEKFTIRLHISERTKQGNPKLIKKLSTYGKVSFETETDFQIEGLRENLLKVLRLPQILSSKTVSENEVKAAPVDSINLTEPALPAKKKTPVVTPLTDEQKVFVEQLKTQDLTTIQAQAAAILQLRKAKVTVTRIAEVLNELHVPTHKHNARWWPSSLQRVVEKAQEMNAAK